MSETPPEDQGEDQLLALVTAYVDDVAGTGTHSADQLGQAYRAEKAAQRSVCKVPDEDGDLPDDLIEALCRRVAHNLAVRSNPLGVQLSSDGGSIRIGGRDSEVRRLEKPHRKRVFG